MSDIIQATNFFTKSQIYQELRIKCSNKCRIFVTGNAIYNKFSNLGFRSIESSILETINSL